MDKGKQKYYSYCPTCGLQEEILSIQLPINFSEKKYCSFLSRDIYYDTCPSCGEYRGLIKMEENSFIVLRSFIDLCKPKEEK